MDTFDLLAQGLAVALQPSNLLFCVVGCLLGTLVGALPGLGPSNGVAILIPFAFAFGLPAETAMILMTAVYSGAMFGGRISSIVLNVPGDEPAMMTCLDGHPMARQGRAAEALAVSAIASFVGGIIAVVGLMLLAPLIARFALRFGPPEYFALYFLAFSTLGGIGGGGLLKVAAAACLGLMLSTVGLDPDTGVARYTFGLLHLLQGIDFIVLIIGLFAITELLAVVEAPPGAGAQTLKLSSAGLTLKSLAFSALTMLRGAIVGFVAGVLPGSGPSLGSFVAYTWEKLLHGSGASFGSGDPRGVAAPESANNSAAIGALVPMLTLGVPGSGTTAVLLALLVTLNVTPGPLLMTQNPDLFWGIVAALLIGSLVLLVLNIPLVSIFVRILMTPRQYLFPIVMMLALVGAYAVANSTFNLWVAFIFGGLGFALRKFDVPLIPIVLGVLVGPAMEKNFRHTLILSDGDWSGFFDSGVAISLWLIAAIFLSAPIVMRGMRGTLGDE